MLWCWCRFSDLAAYTAYWNNMSIPPTAVLNLVYLFLFSIFNILCSPILHLYIRFLLLLFFFSSFPFLFPLHPERLCAIIRFQFAVAVLCWQISSEPTLLTKGNIKKKKKTTRIFGIVVPIISIIIILQIFHTHELNYSNSNLHSLVSREYFLFPLQKPMLLIVNISVLL